MTTFRHALMICGLTHAEAADFLGVRPDTIHSWSSGRRRVPPGVWEMLAGLYEQIQDAATGAADVMVRDGIDPRAWNKIEADLVGRSGETIPTPGALAAAGAAALLMAVGSYARESPDSLPD